MRISINNRFVIAFVMIGLFLDNIQAATKNKATQKKASDPNDNKGNTPFFLQDPYDETCLGPNGFTVCDERSLWILTRRAGQKTYSLVSLLNPSPHGMCLEKKKTFFGLISSDQVGMGLCSKSGSKSWEFNFVDNTHVKLATKGQCLVRGKKTYKNSVSVQNCKKGEFLPLVYNPTSVHEAGFHLKAGDGSCFDGSKFRSCEGSGSNMLLWGIGIKYIWGKANRYIFNFHPQDRGNCLVAHGSKIEKSSCTSNGAMKWGLSDGKLSIDNGRMCLVRLPDNMGAMAKCSEANEYMSMDVPTAYTSEDLAAMMKNQDNLSIEQKAALQQMARDHTNTKV